MILGHAAFSDDAATSRGSATPLRREQKAIRIVSEKVVRKGLNSENLCAKSPVDPRPFASVAVRTPPSGRSAVNRLVFSGDSGGVSVNGRPSLHAETERLTQGIQQIKNFSGVNVISLFKPCLSLLDSYKNVNYR
ncbi:hypothetical protein GWI33_005813 [Rhynchophorus ferrugineus]|uniref:Uncharacterized protein n=1 Tax=Rhynchophorus ferrugineus TaxID=354439 RepID=A0A834IMC8_RHYFE|nr:hypothetical protein GWI33_005813 [Rhynchophorus ferrugineus]